MNIILYWTGWDTIFKMFIVLCIGLLVLFCFRCLQKAEQRIALDAKHAVWLCPYFITIGLTSWAGHFGGGHAYIAFGWDMVWVAVFASLFFIWGVKRRLPGEQVFKQVLVTGKASQEMEEKESK